jgi:hypothetical protein
MELGYRFAPPAYPHAPGSPCLEVNINQTPTLKHFDPDKLILNVVSKDGFPNSLTIFHPWYLRDATYRVCVGDVILVDRKAKKVVAYTLGGDLHVRSESKKTQCRLESEVPILRQGKLFEIPTQLACDIRILISKRAAARLPDSSKHQKLQACAEPMELYAACLKALKAKYENHIYQDLKNVIKMRNLITNEIIALQDINRWPVTIPVLEELL